MEYDNKNTTSKDKVDGQFTEEEAIAYSKVNKEGSNSNAKLLVKNSYEKEIYINKVNFTLADLVDCDYYHNLRDDVITCVKSKTEFDLVYSFSDKDIIDGVATIGEFVMATNDLIRSIADNSQHFKKLSKDSPRMPELKSINLVKKENTSDDTSEDDDSKI